MSRPDAERLRAVAREAVRVSQWHGAIGSGPLEVLDAELGDLGRHARSVLAEIAPTAEESGRAWAEQMIQRWSPDEISEATERKARELAGPNHRHGAIPARFWREAIAALAPSEPRP